MQQTPTSDERILAVLAHISALAFGMGLILPVALWDGQRAKSKYAAFQALQAYGYQSLGYTVWLLLSMLVVVVFLAGLLLISLLLGESNDLYGAFFAVFSGLILIVFFLSFAFYLLTPVVGAVLCGLGREFRYPFLGRRLAVYLDYDAEHMADDRQQRWVAAMGHFAVILPLWGLLGPLYAWVSQGKRTEFLRIQSAQTTIFQAGVTLLTYGLSFLYMIFVVLAMLLTTPFQDASQQLQAPDGQMPALVALLALLCVFCALLLMLPLLHILGQWAGLRVLQGHDFRYPLLGRLVENWKNKALAERSQKGTGTVFTDNKETR